MKHVKLVSKPVVASVSCIDVLINEGPSAFLSCMSDKKDAKTS